MKLKTLICILSFTFLSCGQNKKNQQSEEDKKYEIELSQREQEAATKKVNDAGEIINEFSFEIKTNDPDFDGKIPWASIENPQNDLENLISKNDIIIHQNKITVIIDYPLTNEYRFELESDKGFSRADLLTEISNHYYQLYKEEEETATVKTLPMEKRTIYNRNKTNGKYGIWGHDIADLVLTDIYVYKTTDGKIILTMNVDS